MGTYTWNYYHDSDHTAKGKFVTITIRDPCEPPAKVTMAAWLPLERYVMGSGPKVVKLPQVTVDPAKCTDGVGFDVTIPDGLKEILSVNDKGDLLLGGITQSTNANQKYSIVIQAVTAEGLDITDLTATWTLDFQDKKKQVPQEMISSVSAAAGAVFGAGGRIG